MELNIGLAQPEIWLWFFLFWHIAVIEYTIYLLKLFFASCPCILVPAWEDQGNQVRKRSTEGGLFKGEWVLSSDTSTSDDRSWTSCQTSWLLMELVSNMFSPYRSNKDNLSFALITCYHCRAAVFFSVFHLFSCLGNTCLSVFVPCPQRHRTQFYWQNDFRLFLLFASSFIDSDWEFII